MDVFRIPAQHLVPEATILGAYLETDVEVDYQIVPGSNSIGHSGEK